MFYHHHTLSLCKVALNIPESLAVKMSSPASRRSRGHSSRKSQSSTPVPQPPSSPKGSQKSNGAGMPSSSPMFFQSSSPSRSASKQQQQQRSIDDMIISSPPRQPSVVGDRESTPRASRQPAPGGKMPFKRMRLLLMHDRIFSCPLRPKLKSACPPAEP